jgi:putative Ig domain-containing protein
MVPVLLVLLVGTTILPHILPVLPPSPSSQFSNVLSSGVLMAVQHVTSSSSQLVSSISGDDIQVSTSTLSENEPSVALNPSDPHHLAAGANEQLATGVNWLGVYTSSDDGLSWMNGLIPTQGLTSYSDASDPAVSFSQNGTLYYVGLAFNTNFQRGTAIDGTVFVSKSTDDGSSFPQTTIVSSSSGKIFNDKPYLAVDETNGPFEGTVYVSWTRFMTSGSSTTSDIMVSYSRDGGRSFSFPTKVSSSLLNQGSLPVVGPGGDLYVVWNDLSNSRIMEAKATDGGVSFSGPVAVSSYVPLPMFLPNSLFRVNSNPAAAADDTNGNVYAAWADYRTGYAEILSSRSLDGGTTWSKPIRVNDDNTTNDHFFPWMAMSHGLLSIVFYDRRLDPQNHFIDVFYAESVDGGSSFSPNIRVTDVSSNPDAVVFSNGESFIGDYIGIASNGTLAHPVWTDLRNVSPINPSNEDIFTEARRVDRPPVFAPVENQTAYPGAELQFSVKATDPDVGQISTISALGVPSGATFASTPSTNGTVIGSFDWTPSAMQAPNNFSVEFSASDGFLVSTTNVIISVKANSAPSLTVPGPQTVTAGSILTFIVSATDSDAPPDFVTISCDNCAQLGATFDSSSGNFTWIPALSQGPGDYSVNFTATDHLLPSLSDTKSVAVHVDMLNRPPSLTPIKDWTINDETLLTFKANATDPDIPPEPLTFSLGSDVPAGASMSLDGVFSWTPTEAQGGTYQFTVTVSDGALTDSRVVRVTVVEVEQPPVLTVPGPQTVEIGNLLIFTVNATNPDDDDPATISAYNLPVGASFDPDLGSFVWTPNDGQGPAVYAVAFKAVEPGPNGFSDIKTVTINVERSSPSSGQPFGAGGLSPVLWLGTGVIVLISALVSIFTVRARRREKKARKESGKI